MIVRLAWLIAALIAPVCAQASGSHQPPTGMLPSRPITAAGKSWTYGLYVPASYDPAKPLPMILCLHGLGFTGDNYLKRWQPRLAERYIVACPTHPEAEWWTPESEALSLAVLQAVSAEYVVDPERIFLTGMSNGGVGALWIGARQARHFAGVAPMAASFETEWYPLLANFKNTPLYIIHGSKDQVMPVQIMRDVAAELRRLGAPVIYREHDREHPQAGGHYFPVEELPALLEWFDAMRRSRWANPSKMYHM